MSYYPYFYPHLYLHPTLPEALTVEELSPNSFGPCTLTRWSLATTPATPLLQRSIYYDIFSYRDNGQLVTTQGGLSAPLDDGSFALISVDPRASLSKPILEICQWQDLSTLHTIPFPCDNSHAYACSPACSPDGRWLVANMDHILVLFDRLSGEVMSFHQTKWIDIAALAFDGTSRFVAAILYNQGGGDLLLWRLDPIEHSIPHVGNIPNFFDRSLPLDHVWGKVALSRLHSDLSSKLSSDIIRSFGDLAGDVAFSPDSRMVVFCLAIPDPKKPMIAYEVPSGRLLWVTHLEHRLTPFVFAPDGNILVVGNENGELLLYGCDDGNLRRRMSTGLGKPIYALAFDHDGTSMWLVSDNRLVLYPLSLELQE